MIPLLCLYIIRKIKTGDFKWFRLKRKRFIRFAAGIGMVLLTSVSPFTNYLTDGEFQTFKVIRKGREIGIVEIRKFINGDEITYEIESKIRTKIIVNINIYSKERSIYRGDTLIYSKVFRKVNKRIKIQQELKLIDGNYILKNKGEISHLGPAITQINLASMLCIEPVENNTVFSDGHNRLLNLHALGYGKYRIVMPNGDKHTFIYEGGICKEVQASGRFYKIRLERS